MFAAAASVYGHGEAGPSRREVLERLQRGVTAHAPAYRAFHGRGVALQLGLLGDGGGGPKCAYVFDPFADMSPGMVNSLSELKSHSLVFL